MKIDRGPLELLSVAEMYRADSAAEAAGVPSLRLMENAGAAITDAVLARWDRRPTVVLCGPGNNGGDGFVVARRLAERGWPVSVALLGGKDRLKGDAAVVAGRWTGPVAPLEPEALDGARLVVDALFGAGLGRDVEGAPAAVLEDVIRRRLPTVAVDVPSGVHGDTGEIKGLAAPAALTVTFFRAKPGHLLMPGRETCGELVVADIGIPARVLAEIAPKRSANGPGLWQERFPWSVAGGHKYGRGHAVVSGGGAASSGAARLGARAALRVGAGLVTVAVPPDAVAVYGAHLTAVMLAPVADDEAFESLIADPRKNAVLLGPGGGVGESMRRRTLAALRARKACVLDADAITSFADSPETLFAAMSANCVLTPHEGEFRRLFDVGGDKLARASAAAETSGAIMLLKGHDTVIAAPDGRAAVNANAPAELATAGAGDVLSGLILGLLAQGMDAFDAACAAAWLHGEAASAVGPGLIAEDLSEAFPSVLRRLRNGLA